MRYFIYTEDDLEDAPVIVSEVASDWTFPEWPEYGDGSDYADSFARLIVPAGKVASEEGLRAMNGGEAALARWRGGDDATWDRITSAHHRRLMDEELIRLRDKGDPIAAVLLDSDDDYERTRYVCSSV